MTWWLASSFRLPTRPSSARQAPPKLTWRYCGPVPSSCNRGLMPSDPLRRAGMEQYVGLDVSQEQTSVCVIDGGGKVIWEGKCASTPEAIAATIRTRAPEAVRIGLESGPLSAWHWHELRKPGLPVVCLDARHVKAALALQLNKSDRNDARGLAQIVRTGWYREVAVKSVDSHLVRSLLITRAQLVRMRVDLANQIRGVLKPFGLIAGKGGWAALRRAGAGVGRGRAPAGGGWGVAGGLASHWRADRGARPPARGRSPAGRGGAAADDRTRVGVLVA